MKSFIIYITLLVLLDNKFYMAKMGEKKCASRIIIRNFFRNIQLKIEKKIRG
jgi:hypothetical protein